MPWLCAGGEESPWAGTWVEAGCSFALGLKGSTPVVLPENLEQTVEAGGQLDGIRLIVVAGSFSSRLMPKEKAGKKDRSPSPSGVSSYGKVAYPSSEKKPCIVLALLTSVETVPKNIGKLPLGADFGLSKRKMLPCCPKID